VAPHLRIGEQRVKRVDVRGRERAEQQPRGLQRVRGRLAQS